MKKAIDYYRKIMREALDGLEGLLKDANLEESVEIAYVLYDSSERASDGLEEVKTRIRKSLGAPEAGVHKIEGLSNRQASVTVPKLRYGLRRGHKREDLQDLFTQEQLDLMFPTRTSVSVNRDAIEEFLPTATPEQKEALVSAIQQRDPTYRVSFKK